MVDFSLDEKIGGSSLLAAGIISAALIINGNISTSTAWIGSIIAVAGGIYSYLEKPYNEIALFGSSIGGIFLLGPALLLGISTSSLVGISIYGIILLMITSVIAGLIDIAEEFF